MNTKPTKLVIIMPCKNEADNLKIVVAKLRVLQPAAIVIGLDPGTTDTTRTVAEELGCNVVAAGRSGYDSAVDAATLHARKAHHNSSELLLLYTDAGNKYNYDQVPRMITMIQAGNDMVLAVRKDISNTLKWHQKLGTKLVLTVINLLTRQKIQDISPFRLVKSSVFDVVEMDPQRFRWPTELLVKALACGLRIGQIDIVPLPRQGTSKVSGSISNSIRAGWEMFSSVRFVNYKKEATYAKERDYVTKKH